MEQKIPTTEAFRLRVSVRTIWPRGGFWRKSDDALIARPHTFARHPDGRKVKLSAACIWHPSKEEIDVTIQRASYGNFYIASLPLDESLYGIRSIGPNAAPRPVWYETAGLTPEFLLSEIPTRHGPKPRHVVYGIRPTAWWTTKQGKICTLYPNGAEIVYHDFTDVNELNAYTGSFTVVFKRWATRLLAFKQLPQIDKSLTVFQPRSAAVQSSSSEPQIILSSDDEEMLAEAFDTIAEEEQSAGQDLVEIEMDPDNDVAEEVDGSSIPIERIKGINADEVAYLKGKEVNTIKGLKDIKPKQVVSDQLSQKRLNQLRVASRKLLTTDLDT